MTHILKRIYLQIMIERKGRREKADEKFTKHLKQQQQQQQQ